MEKEEIKERYVDYKLRIEQRIGNGETIKVKAFPDWIRKIKDPKDSHIINVAGESGETSTEIFKRLGEARTKKVLIEMHTLYALTKYNGTVEQRTKITDILQIELDKLKAEFSKIALPKEKQEVVVEL